MNIFFNSTGTGDILIISADEHLDLLSYGEFCKATAIAINNPRSSAIIVDLSRTRLLFDSGNAMLMILRQHAGHLKNHIYLVNANPAIRKKLMQCKFTKLFHIANMTTSNSLVTPKPQDNSWTDEGGRQWTEYPEAHDVFKVAAAFI